MIFESAKTLKNLPFLFGKHLVLAVTLHPAFQNEFQSVNKFEVDT